MADTIPAELVEQIARSNCVLLLGPCTNAGRNQCAVMNNTGGIS